ncbi:hypothetical protein LAZ67_8003743 [Cordylochernes scorpioides]|uniref:SAM domain-containing protein n=1 Tax=Cordylochernes scorpioides TaxID=51811 RepID=A0ABY6KUK9_9ARAC|nr:hypothetical protein LAZ67_8003743 [Cordylochernes scorpioides]
MCAAPAPPKRDPRTTLTVGRTRARSMVAGLAEIEALDRTLNDYDSEGRSTKSSSVESISARTAPNSEDGSTKVASIRSRPSSRRLTPQELEAFFDRQEGKPPSRPPRVFGSVAAMKRSKASRVAKVASFVRQLHKNFHSTPDLNAPDGGDGQGQRCYSQEDLPNSRHSWAFPSWRALDDKIYAQTMPVKKRASCPPPTHPPPPPPVGQMIKVDVSKASDDYANLQILQEENSVMSSFRPGDSAKLYASPESIVSVAHHSPRSRSVPPPVTTHNSETETSGDSGVANLIRSRQRESTDSGHASDKGTLKKSKAPVYTPQFERSDSDSPARRPQYRNPEPFIPEPDYESSEDDDLPLDHSSSLSTFGKTDSVIEIMPSTEAAKPSQTEIDEQIEALSEAQKACQEAKERLRHAKVEKATESKATQSEIESPIKARPPPPPPQEEPPRSEEPIEPPPPPPPPSHKEASQQTVKTDPRAIIDLKSKENIQQIVFRTKELEKKGPVRDHSPTMRSRRKKDGLRIALTGAQIKLGSNSEGANLPLRIPPNCPKSYFQDEMERYENSSSGVSSDLEGDRACQNGRMEPGMWSRRNRTLPKHMYQATPLVNASKERASPRRAVRVQVDTVGRAGINEVDVLTQLVPPPPEFSEAIAPPPGFSDDSPPPSLRLQSADAMRYMYSKDFQHPRTSTLQPSRVTSSASPSGKIYPEYASTSTMTSHRGALKSSGQQKSFRLKALHMWTEKDVCDWLESLYLPEYRGRFAEAGITGPKLARMDNNDLVGLGVRQVGHRINMERSLRRYLTASTAH